jgi:hypothetical protein
MRAALLRYANGKPTRLPMRVLYHLVAARYATTPRAVRGWPADDFLDACELLEVTGNGGR